MENYLYDGKELDVKDIISMRGSRITLADHIIDRIDANRKSLESLLNASDQQYYGINTGFGSLYRIPISAGDIQKLQFNLIRSHACGVGPAAPMNIVKLTLLLK